MSESTQLRFLGHNGNLIIKHHLPSVKNIPVYKLIITQFIFSSVRQNLKYSLQSSQSMSNNKIALHSSLFASFLSYLLPLNLSSMLIVNMRRRNIFILLILRHYYRLLRKAILIILLLPSQTKAF
jgi:hypothetical protein